HRALPGEGPGHLHRPCGRLRTRRPGDRRQRGPDGGPPGGDPPGRAARGLPPMGGAPTGRAGTGASYASAGVHLAAADAVVERLKELVTSTDRPGVLGSIGGFGGLFALDTERYRHPVLVSSTDGVGTKMLVARALGPRGRYAPVGLPPAALCAPALVWVGAEPLFFLDYVATGRLDPDRLVE